jgi:acetate kinase
MGFTPLEGLVMATRSGSIDPGLVLWLEQHVGMPPAELAEVLENRSGLLGLGGHAEMPVLLSKRETGDHAATLATDVYIHRLCAGIAAMAAAMDGLDVLVFTGGVGENSAPIREYCTRRLGFLGVRIDFRRNNAVRGDQQIGSADSEVAVVVVTSREDLQIAHEVRQLLRG